MVALRDPKFDAQLDTLSSLSANCFVHHMYSVNEFVHEIDPKRWAHALWSVSVLHTLVPHAGGPLHTQLSWQQNMLMRNNS